MVHRIDGKGGRRGPRHWLFAAVFRSSVTDDRMGEVQVHKRLLLSPLKGTVVEFGPGTGANFAYYDAAAVEWIGIEPNLHMHAALLHAAEQHGIRGELSAATAEASGLPDACADAVVSTHVMCSVTDVQAAYREALRLLRPGGVFAFVEHVGAPPGSGQRRVQRAIQPVWSFAADGCHPDRDLEAVLRAAGFASVEVTRFRLNLPIVSPHIAGLAWK
jgi:SAM-dependent methyltransferase